MGYCEDPGLGQMEENGGTAAARRVTAPAPILQARGRVRFSHQFTENGEAPRRSVRQRQTRGRTRVLARPPLGVDPRRSLAVQQLQQAAAAKRRAADAVRKRLLQEAASRSFALRQAAKEREAEATREAELARVAEQRRQLAERGGGTETRGQRKGGWGTGRPGVRIPPAPFHPRARRPPIERPPIERPPIERPPIERPPIEVPAPVIRPADERTTLATAPGFAPAPSVGSTYGGVAGGRRAAPGGSERPGFNVGALLPIAAIAALTMFGGGG